MSLKQTKSDQFYCESVAKSISEIIRFSLDEEFRKNSFKLFGVSSTKETEEEISRRLMLIIENSSAPRHNKTSRKRRKKLTEERGKENLKEKQSISDTKNVEQSSNELSNSSRTDSQILPQNFLQKNWLQISSQKYRDVVKRRKLNYFSEPQFGLAYENDIESTCDVHLSNSQPVPLVSGSLFNEKIEFFNNFSNKGAGFCQKMFKVSFKDNAQKYLKKNLKSHKHLNF